ncbi:MAG: MCE family protein [Ectothiorhodospiraceae bacterium]|nr:MCE family protein [Chromatiales bacterium]MCP5156920.1 MCE family protein [Ectothiorhodospiraceae bacterium]
MEGRVNHALVGLFVLVVGAAVTGLVLWVAFGARHEQTTTYAIYPSESVSGLSVKAPVKFKGVDVGRVSAVELAPGEPARARVLLEIREPSPVRADTTATLSSQGLTGIAFVELAGGSPSTPAPVPRAGESWPEIPTRPSLLVRLDTAVSGMLGEVRAAAGELRVVAERLGILLDDRNTEVTREILLNVRDLSASLVGHVQALAGGVDGIRRLTDDASQVGSALPGLMDRVGESLGALERTASAIAAAARGVDQLATAARTELAGAAREAVPEATRALGQLRELATRLNRLSQQLERDPSALIRGRAGQPRGPGE